MFRFNRWVCALAVCLAVGAVYAKAIKVKGLVPVGVGVTENPDADGMAIANYHQGNNQTEIQMAITGFQPNTTYHVAFDPGIGKAYVLTNSAGNASSHHFVHFDVCAWGRVEVCAYVFIDDDDDPAEQGWGQRDADGSEDRAMGCTPCP